MKFCCDIFQWKVNGAGEAGLSMVLVEFPTLSTIRFCMQSRAVDFGQEWMIVDQNAAHTSGRYVILWQQCIKYCPYCGQDLSQLINVNRDDVRELLERHRKYASEE